MLHAVGHLILGFVVYLWHYLLALVALVIAILGSDLGEPVARGICWLVGSRPIDPPTAAMGTAAPDHNHMAHGRGRSSSTARRRHPRRRLKLGPDVACH
ncbi:MAG TPA: hypothetical protein VII06_11595 [Chloroflexota bacterium]|jgi:hypothetical protein